jgi:hypothetical protein
MTRFHRLSGFNVRDSISRVCNAAPASGDPTTTHDVGGPGPCPEGVVKPGQWPDPRPLSGIVPYPFIAPSGKVQTTAGSDEETGMYAQPNFVPLPVPDAPTAAQQRQAMLKLMYVVKDVPFQDAQETRIDETPDETYARLEHSDHFAAFLAAWFTPPTRPAYEGPSPGFAFDGSQRGVGTTTLKGIIEQTWLGYEMESGVQSRGLGGQGEDEDRKKFTMLVMKGTPMFAVNNIAKPFGNATWAAALTANTWSERLLGTMDQAVYPLKTTFYLNGVQLTWTADMPRRILDVMIETHLQRPERRDFSEPDLIGYVKAHRAALVQACLTILRARTVKAEKVDDLPNPGPTGSFDAWSRVVRGAILDAGMRDPWNCNVALCGDDETAKHPSLVDVPDGLAEPRVGAGPHLGQ